MVTHFSSAAQALFTNDSSPTDAFQQKGEKEREKKQRNLPNISFFFFDLISTGISRSSD